MTTPNDGWTSSRHRKPGKSDTPYWLACDGAVYLEYNLDFSRACDFQWRKANVPAAPRRGPTQREEDVMAFGGYEAETMCDAEEARPAWHAALKWERAEITKILDLTPDDKDFVVNWYSTIMKRCRLST